MTIKNEHIVVLGGAGYFGLFHIHAIKEKHPETKVTIVTTNLTKEVFFKGVDVNLVPKADAINNEEIVIVNLAYSVGTYFNDTKAKNAKIIDQISLLASNNRVSRIIHVSSIVLSLEQSSLGVSEILKNDTYYFAKSYAESELQKIYDRYKIPTVILRSGNIVGPGSPWINAILNRLYDGLPITGKGPSYPSNSTFVGNLSFAIDWLSKAELRDAVTVMDFCELGDVNWKVWINDLNKDYHRNVIEWKAKSSEDFAPSLAEDLKNFKSVMMSLAIPTLFKGRKTNNLIIKIIDFLGLSKAKEKAKARVRDLNTDKSHYINLMEYSSARVFLNTKGKKLDNVPEALKQSLPYDYQSSLRIIEQWMDFAGFNKLFGKN